VCLLNVFLTDSLFLINHNHMNPPNTKKFQLNEFFPSGLESATNSGCLINVDGSEIPVKLKLGYGDDLVVLFHPSLKPFRLGKNWFQPFLPVSASQISIADPTLQSMEGVSVGWYLGGEAESLPDKILRIIQAVADFLGCRRRVYVGGSSGGFAALLYAGLDSDSVAVAACPQTSLKNYRNPAVGQLVAQRYSFTKSLPPEASLPSFFADKWSSAAVVLVSSDDPSHLYNQVLPFFSVLGNQHSKKLVLNVAYHGVRGHSGSIPPDVYLPWVRSVLLCPDFESDKLMVLHRMINGGIDMPFSGEARQQVLAHSLSTESTRSVSLADILRDYHLRQPTEE
jgi:hypothetical protein